MSARKSLFAATVVGAAASTVGAAIIPSWRINPITPAAIAANPQLTHALSVSLMVELTGGSLFNVAGLDLAQVIPGQRFFNQAGFGSDTRPNSALFPLFPDLEFDSYVATTTTQAPAVPGRLRGSGAAQVGEDDEFNVAWGATPNTGGSGPLEIARITMLHDLPGVINPFNLIPLTNGLIADSLNPNTNIALPPMPAIVPEPASFLIGGLGLLMLRRK